MIFETLNDDYYGIKVTFSDNPIKGFPTLRTFSFSGEKLISLLAQTIPQFHETLLAPLKYTPAVIHPVKATAPMEWFNIAQLPEQGQGNTQANPKLVFDVGGRKMIIKIPSDKYVYDEGELPLYAIRCGLDPIDDSEKILNILVPHEQGSINDILLDPSIIGKNRILSLQGKERLSYIDFYQLLSHAYGTNLNSSWIAAISRQVLQGKRLPSAEAPVICAIIASQFVSEVSRNRSSLVTSLMLLDLIQARIPAPSLNNEFDFYRYENVLWHPELYNNTGHKRRNDPRIKALGNLGGFHPMAHTGSWSNEFKDNPYQIEHELTWANVKSAAIIIDWLCHLPNAGMQITRLTKEQYQQERTQEEENITNLRAAGKRIQSPHTHILSSFLHPLIQQRLSSFDLMLNPAESLDLSDKHYFAEKTGSSPPPATPEKRRSMPASQAMDRDRDIEVIQQKLEQQADEKMRELKIRAEEYAKQKQDKMHADTCYKQTGDEGLKNQINVACQDRDKAITYLQAQFPSFTQDDLAYVLSNTTLSLQQVAFLIVKLHVAKEPRSMSLSSITLNISPEEKNIVFRLVISNEFLRNSFSLSYKNLAGYIISLGFQTPIPTCLVDILFEKRNANFLQTLSGEELFEMSAHSKNFFKKLFLSQPDLFYKLKEKKAISEVDGLIINTAEERGLGAKGFTQEELEQAKSLYENDQHIQSILKICKPKQSLAHLLAASLTHGIGSAIPTPLESQTEPPEPTLLGHGT